MSMNVKSFGLAAAIIGAALALSARAAILSALDGGSFFSSDMIRLIVGTTLFVVGTAIVLSGFKLQEREDGHPEKQS